MEGLLDLQLVEAHRLRLRHRPLDAAAARGTDLVVLALLLGVLVLEAARPEGARAREHLDVLPRALELQAAPRVLDLRLQRLLPLHLLHGVLLPHHLVEQLTEPLLLLLIRTAAVAAPPLLLLVPPLPLLLQLLRPLAIARDLPLAQHALLLLVELARLLVLLPESVLGSLDTRRRRRIVRCLLGVVDLREPAGGGRGWGTGGGGAVAWRRWRVA